MQERQALLQQAIQLLSRREYSARELQRKLEAGQDAELVAEALTELQRQGLQSDERFAEVWVRHRVLQGHGPIKVQMELRQKGIAGEVISRVLTQGDVDWFEQARAIYQRRFGLRPPADPREKARQMRFLQYRGFNADQIRYAMENPE